MSKADDTNKHLRASILDVLCYLSLFGIKPTDQELLQLLPVKASMVGMRTHLLRLGKQGKVVRSTTGHYYLKKTSYKRHVTTLSQPQKHLIKLLRLIPFVKVIATTHTQLSASNGQLIVLTSPNRLYITKTLLDILWRLSTSKKTRINPKPEPVFYTTAGIRFVDAMGYDSLSRTLWFALAEPLYGTQAWHTTLRANTFIASHVPNYIWQKRLGKIFTSASKYIDEYDNRRYKHYLKAMSQEAYLQSNSALLRVRPDGFVAIVGHHQTLVENRGKYSETRAKL